MAKHSILIDELTRTVDEGHPRVKAPIGDMPEEAAETKVVTWLFLSVGEPARKLFKDSYPELSVWTLQTREILQRCENCFYIARNRTLDRHKFLSRKQQANESLQQFWHALNGLASKCELGEFTQTLVHDVFILNMNNKKVQEKLCVEPFNDPQEALQYAISYEEGIKRQRSMGIGVAEGSKATKKTEPVCAVDNRECFRCGAGNFTTDHIKKCPATNHKYEFCNITGHLEKCCNQKYPERKRQMKQRMQNRRQGFSRVNYISEDSEEEFDEDEMVIGRDWLTALKYRIEPPITKGENAVNSISRESDESENKLSRDAQQLVQEFPNLFKRRGRVNNNKIKIEMKDGTRITQQKGRRIPIQFQDQVHSEIKNLLDQGHIERVDTIKDDVFIKTSSNNGKEISICKNSFRCKSAEWLDCKR